MSESAERVPQSFRRESRLFLWIALLLILFLNFLTLIFFRNAVAWGQQEAERRAGEILRRVALSAARPDATEEAMERGAIEPDVAFIATFDENGRRLSSVGPGPPEAPRELPGPRPPAGRVVHEWREKPPLLFSTFSTGRRIYAIAVDPGAGTALMVYARRLSLFVPLASLALVVLAGFYLRSLLKPYERLLEAAGGAPAAERAGGEQGDERQFLLSRFESTIETLHEKERELERLAKREKDRADDLETAARTLSRNLPTGLLSVDPGGAVVEINESGREILKLARDGRGEPFERLLAEAPDFRALVGDVLENRTVAGRREARWRRAGAEERILGVTATPAEGGDGRFLGAVALFSDLTEIRRLEGRIALVRHLADLGEVSAGAAHEFRNAAAAIDGYADLALRVHTAEPERAAEYVRAIRREAQEMSRVTSDFLLFAKPETFSPEPVDLESRRGGRLRRDRARPSGADGRDGTASFRPSAAPRSCCAARSPTCSATPPRRRPGALEGARRRRAGGSPRASGRRRFRSGTAARGSTPRSARRSSCRSTPRSRAARGSVSRSWPASPSSTAGPWKCRAARAGEARSLPLQPPGG